MVAFRSSSAAAVLGAVAFQAVSILLPRSASASWGWTQTVPEGANFACAEGTPIGCAGMCAATTPVANFTCTVQSAEGYTCNESSIQVHCMMPDGKAFLPNLMDENDKACKSPDNKLSWSAVPMCTMSGTTMAPAGMNSSMTTKAPAAATISGASQAAVSVMGFLSAMLVAGTGLQN
mmetsp:Transcript_21769/g.34868  ORF Transcript_21769/g.34868 Transcript_21769/m.34868 type:complete len:177 (+) Transcript_21769:88-618(+)